MKLNNVIFFCAVTFLALLTFVYSVAQLKHASEKPFWTDEVVGMRLTKSQPFWDTIVSGARLQGSGSPLDYLVLKLFIENKESWNFLQLKETVYLRLFPIAITALSGFFVFCFLSWQALKKDPAVGLFLMQILLFAFAVMSFLFSRLVDHYAVETRPYALWNSLWFVSLAVSLYLQNNRKLFATILILLALSCTATFFQITAMALAYVILYFEKDKIREVFFDGIKLFLVPILINLYYITKVKQFGYSDAGDEWRQFTDLWFHESNIVIWTVIVCLFCYMRKNCRGFGVAILAAFILYLFGPGIYYLTKLKGYFVTERQYIYYNLTPAIFIISMAVLLPEYLKGVSKKYLRNALIVFIIFVGFSTAFRSKIKKRFSLMINNVQLLNADYRILKD